MIYVNQSSEFELENERLGSKSLWSWCEIAESRGDRAGRPAGILIVSRARLQSVRIIHSVRQGRALGPVAESVQCDSRCQETVGCSVTQRAR